MAQPFFQFAPASGAGMGAPCACAAVTGAKGEALTFSRTSAGTCIKSNSVSAFAVGDLVSCGSGLPRVMPGFDGTSILGIAVEPARTNSCTQSQAIDNAAFADFIGTGGAAPTLNGANAAAGPWGTTTAEAYTFAATTGAQASMRSFAGAAAAAYSCGVFVKGQAGSGTMDVCIETNATGPVATCAACAFTSTAYAWCKVEGVTSVASGRCFIGNGSALNGGTARSSNAVYVEQLDLQASTYLSTPIATAGAAATRNGEVARFPFTTPLATGSIAATVVPLGLIADTGWLDISDGVAATLLGTLLNQTGVNSQLWVGGVSKAIQAGMAVGSHRISGKWDSTGTASCVDGTCTTGTTATPGTTPATVDLLDYMVPVSSFGAHTAPGVIKQVCIDTSSARCF